MASTQPERPLRAMVARLSRLSDDDIAGVLAHLSPDEVRAVERMLATLDGTKTDEPALDLSVIPRWALERLDQGSRAKPAPVLHAWAWPSTHKARLTAHAAQVLERVVFEMATAPRRSGGSDKSRSGIGANRLPWKWGAVR